jgi:PLP dependent protein
MSASYEEFCQRLSGFRAQVAEACQAAGRAADSVSILPVTKNHPPEVVAWVARAGLSTVGENRVQEARDKQTAVGIPTLRWELIGHLQSNKARLAASLFTRVQSIDSPKLLDVLERACSELGRTLEVLIQVNAGRDPAKFGCELEDAPQLVERALTCPHLQLGGLMSIAPLSEDPLVAERTFAALRQCRDDLTSRFGVPLPELSMGMSGDWRLAVAAGSTQIRVGTALFGERH